jgi:protein-L-isoaspartate(D-aspartate) O-methyltransferase
MLYYVFLNSLGYAKMLYQKKLLFTIIKAMHIIDRKFFVLPSMKNLAYEDTALPILHNQTISQPTTVARMLLMAFNADNEAEGELLLQKINDLNVLEIGTGSGWNISLINAIRVIASMYEKAKQTKQQIIKGKTISVEIIKELTNNAKKNIKALIQHLNKARNDVKLIKAVVTSLNKMQIINNDAFNEKGKAWKNKYDIIIFTAGIPNIEIENSVRQMSKKLLKEGGMTLCPSTYGPIIIFRKNKNRVIKTETKDEYMFVPLVKV